MSGYAGEAPGGAIAGTTVAGSFVFVAGQANGTLTPGTVYATDPATGIPVALPASVAQPGQLSSLLYNLPASTGSVAIFADPAVNGLLRSDGTPAGTYGIPVAQAASTTTPSGLTNTDGLAALAFYGLDKAVLFEGTGADNRSDLFRTDGTASGTTEIASLPYLGTTSQVPEFDPLATLNGRAIFVGPGAAGVPGLWSTDGTAAGTVPLALLPPIPTSGGADAQSVAILGNRLVIAYDGGLYVTDGTVAGTASLGNLGADSQTRNISPDNLAVIGDRIVFDVYRDDPGGQSEQLWSTDGTPAGTQQIPVSGANTAPSTIGTIFDPGSLTSLGTLAVFSANGTLVTSGGDIGIPDLWATDGTAAGTVDIGVGREPEDLTALGDRALFEAGDASGGTSAGLWITDGTAAGTTEIAPGINAYGSITVVAGGAYVSGLAGLYFTDGTTAGTRLISGTAGLDAEAVTPVPSPLGFTGTPRDYVLAPTAAGDLQVRDLTTAGAAPLDLPDARVLSFGDGSTVLFDASGTAEDIARIYLAAYGRAPDLSGLLSYTEAVQSGAMTLLQVANGAAISTRLGANVNSGINLNPLPLSNAQFLSYVYAGADGRAPDPGGLAAYTAALQDGQGRGQVLLSIAESPEAQVHSLATAGDADVATITRLYEAIDGRAPDVGGLIGYTSALGAGQSVAQIAAAMLSGSEYASSFGSPTNSAFVTNLYHNLLARAPDTGGLASYTAALNAGESRAQLVAGFINSDEANLITAPLTHLGYVSTG